MDAEKYPFGTVISFVFCGRTVTAMVIASECEPSGDRYDPVVTDEGTGFYASSISGAKVLFVYGLTHPDADNPYHPVGGTATVNIDAYPVEVIG